MFPRESQSLSPVIVLAPVSAANTAAATSAGVPVAGYEGDLVFIEHVGANTGSITGKIQQCDDTGGTNAEDITGATFTVVNAPGGSIQKVIVPRKAFTRTHARYLGTIVTGPALVGVAMLATPKYT